MALSKAIKPSKLPPKFPCKPGQAQARHLSLAGFMREDLGDEEKRKWVLVLLEIRLSILAWVQEARDSFINFKRSLLRGEVVALRILAARTRVRSVTAVR